jgi:hypothetical protein
MEEIKTVKELIAQIENKVEQPVADKMDKKNLYKQYQKKYREENKIAIKEKYSSKVQCKLCDSVVCRSSLSLHMKSKLCENRITLKQRIQAVNGEK